MKNSCCKRFLTPLTAAVLLFVFSSLFSQAVYAQDFSSVDQDLQQLEALIKDTIANTEPQERLLHDLRESLQESESIIANYESRIQEQEILLQNLQAQLQAMSETYHQRSTLSGKSEQRLKFWKTFTIVGIPTTAVISGVVVWVLVK